MFSCGFCEISKNTFSDKLPPVAASVSPKNKIIAEKPEMLKAQFKTKYFEIPVSGYSKNDLTH